MVPFHGAGKGLEADIVGAAVAAEGNEFVCGVQFAFLFQRFVCAFHTA